MKERNNNKQQVEKREGESLIWKRPDRKHLGPAAATNENQAPAGKLHQRETEAGRKATTPEFLCPYSAQEKLFLSTPPGKKNQKSCLQMCRWCLPPAETLMTV